MATNKLTFRQILLSKRLIFGLLAGFLFSLYIFRKPISDLEKVQVFLKTAVPANFQSLFNENQVDSTPSEQFRLKYNKMHDVPYKKRFTLLIPGIGTSHLELWRSKECLSGFLRSHIWGSQNMILSLLANKKCWLEHMKLVNGSDPDQIKVRPVKDLISAEYFIGSYWVWGRIVENLIALDYDINDIHAATYDWRLSHEDLERRDGYFNEIKSTIENKVRHTGLKAVVLTHSMGGLVFYHFIKWVESPLGGNGGDGWISDHLMTIFNIGAPFLGCPKVISGIISGEMKDTAQLGPHGNSILEATFTRAERRDMFWSFYGLFSMLPKGGNRVWGSEWISPDDTQDRPFQKCYREYLKMCMKMSFEFYFANYNLHSGAMITLIEEKIHLTMNSVVESLGVFANKREEWEVIKRLQSYDFVSQKEMDKSDPKDIMKSWTNPLASRLPNIYNTTKTETGKFLLKSEIAKTMKIYCMYGYGKETERKYFYKNAEELKDEIATPHIDVNYIHQRSNTKHGVQLGDGDGTVNVVSLAGVCLEAWRLDKYNPSHIPIITKEYKHEETKGMLSPDEILRGGKKTADHIDILGNYELIEDVLSVAIEPQLPVKSRVRKSTKYMARSLHLSE